jgi:vacuolar-type H+-ATPase subunit I/STV1
LLIISAVHCGENAASTIVTIKQRRGNEHKFYEEVKAKFTEDFEFFDQKARACIQETFHQHMEIPAHSLRVICIGRYNEMMHHVYGKNMKKLKRAFFNLVITSLEPFRVKYEDEIVYFLYILNFIAKKDLKLRESLYSALKMTKYQVHPRRFHDVLKILDELIEDFQTLQDRITEKRSKLVDYLDKQITNRDKYLEELEERRQQLESQKVDSNDIA